MVTKRALDAVNGYVWVCLVSAKLYAINSLLAFQDGPDATEFIFLILNYVTCVPVLLCVGGFR